MHATYPHRGEKKMHGTLPEVTPKKLFSTVSPIWEYRASIAAEMIGDVTAVVDLGCGAMSVRGFLPNTTRYVGVDHLPRDSETIIVDLNTEPLPDFGIRHASMLGVLEYLTDTPNILRQLHRNFDGVVLSYCHHHFFRSTAKRARYWVNHYSSRQFKTLILDAGFRIVEARRLRFGESLYRLESIRA